jgi:hypothetical protein
MLTHFKTFGALLNDVKAEQLLELEDFHRLIMNMEQRQQIADNPTPEGDMIPHWHKLEADWPNVSASAWYKVTYQVNLRKRRRRKKKENK